MTMIQTACINWDGAKTHAGYGQRKIGGKVKYVHRLAYEASCGAIPDGLQIDHLCRNPLCINPQHLDAVTCRENIIRGIGRSALNARKTRCKNGHPFIPSNIYSRPRGGRTCKICARNYRVQWDATHRTRTALLMSRWRIARRARLQQGKSI